MILLKSANFRFCGFNEHAVAVDDPVKTHVSCGQWPPNKKRLAMMVFSSSVLVSSLLNHWLLHFPCPVFSPTFVPALAPRQQQLATTKVQPEPPSVANIREDGVEKSRYPNM